MPEARSACSRATASCCLSPAALVGQAKRFVQEVASGLKGSACILTQAGIEAERKYLLTMIPRVQQVMKQTRERIFKGNPHSSGKLVSLFEAHTEIIRKGKASKPTEFGKMVKIQEAEAQRHALSGLRRASQRLGSVDCCARCP